MRVMTVILAALLSTACDPKAESHDEPRVQTRPKKALDVRSVEVDARPGAASPRLTAGSDGVTLSWIEPDGDGLRLRVRSWGGVTETVVTESQLLQNWADLPSVMPGPGGWIAAWPQLREKGYDLRWAQRDVAGTWTQRGPLSDASEGPEFGFVSWAGNPGGTVAAFWLDGRGSTTSHGGAMQLWTGTIGPDGIADRRVVDARVCDCCQTAAAATPKGPVVAYRDRDENEVRDIWLAGPAPSARRRLGQDDWRIEGCPVNGPSVVTQGESIAVAWFSGATNPGRVRVAFADVEGPFSAPIDVDDGTPIGRVDLAWLDADSVAVTWMETVGREAEIRLRRVTRSGARSVAATLATTEAARRAGFPQVERVGDDLVFAWVGLEAGPSTIVAGTLPVNDVRSL